MKQILLKAIFLVLVPICIFVGCQKEEESKADDSRSVSSAKVDDASLSEDDLWKKEPMYGKEILIGYNGGLCTSAPSLAQVRGFFDKYGVNVKVLRVQSIIDSMGTGKIHLMTDHIATLLVPAVNGIDMVFTTGAHTGCKSLYVLNNGEINSTKDLIGKIVAVPEGIGNSDHNIGLRFFNHDGISPKEVKF